MFLNSFKQFSFEFGLNFFQLGIFKLVIILPLISDFCAEFLKFHGFLSQLIPFLIFEFF
jgi:hypothetical protein